MSTCVQNLKGVFSPPCSHRMGKKGFKRYLMFSALLSATQLNYSFLDLIHLHHFTGLVHNVSLDDTAKLLHYSKTEVLKKISSCSSQPTVLREHHQEMYAPAMTFCWFRSHSKQCCPAEPCSSCGLTYLSTQRHPALLGFSQICSFSAPLQFKFWN